jgi:hypothetical protein
MHTLSSRPLASYSYLLYLTTQSLHSEGVFLLQQEWRQILYQQEAQWQPRAGDHSDVGKARSRSQHRQDGEWGGKSGSVEIRHSSVESCEGSNSEEGSEQHCAGGRVVQLGWMTQANQWQRTDTVVQSKHVMPKSCLRKFRPFSGTCSHDFLHHRCQCRCRSGLEMDNSHPKFPHFWSFKRQYFGHFPCYMVVFFPGFMRIYCVLCEANTICYVPKAHLANLAGPKCCYNGLEPS